MELCDLLYCLVLRHFRDAVLKGKNVEIDYIYDRRAVDVADAHWILLYQVNERVAWFDLGAKNWHKEENVSIDVRTDDKIAYANIKNELFRLFNGTTYAFKPKADYDAIIEEGVSAITINKKSMWVRVAKVIDPMIYSVGDYVRLDYAIGESESGWIVDIYGDEVVVFTRAGTYFLVRPHAVIELSDKMKMLYRFVAEVQGRIILEQ